MVGIYMVKKHRARRPIGEIMRDKKEPMSAYEIAEQMMNRRLKFYAERPKTIAQLLKGAKGITRSKVLRKREITASWTTLYNMEDYEEYERWLND
jgi:repressor of nif and glnA expression|tara:strand:- start:2717 stop:3001 length:285 start_codon:yes stop_codon:yes gene_type:complete